jgi:hypothetical protein
LGKARAGPGMLDGVGESQSGRVRFEPQVRETFLTFSALSAIFGARNQ